MVYKLILKKGIFADPLYNDNNNYGLNRWIRLPHQKRFPLILL